jgi:seryl-tRNA synthetase
MKIGDPVAIDRDYSKTRRSSHLDSVAEDGFAWLVPTLFSSDSGDGVYARTELFDRIIEGLSAFITRYRSPGTEVLRFPPVLNRRQLEQSGYLQSFPHLLGVVSCIDGSESEIRDLVESPEWANRLSATDLVLAPAACYPVYPLAAARGVLVKDRLVFDVASYCFRHESTHELGRLQAFQMREYVCIGTPAEVVDFRNKWISGAEEMAKLLGLPNKIAPASDPFFGRGGKVAARNQLEQSLKFELLIPLKSNEQPTACMSFNYHLDHFGTAWGLRTVAGETAHTACVAFGLDRLALALFATHGINLQSWPAVVHENLAV